MASLASEFPSNCLSLFLVLHGWSRVRTTIDRTAAVVQVLLGSEEEINLEGHARISRQ